MDTVLLDERELRCDSSMDTDTGDEPGDTLLLALLSDRVRDRRWWLNAYACTHTARHDNSKASHRRGARAKSGGAQAVPRQRAVWCRLVSSEGRTSAEQQGWLSGS